MSQKTEDRSKKSEVGRQESEVRSQAIRFGVRIVLVCILSSAFCSLSAVAAEKWIGVDEAVVEKIAKDHGREASAPLINTDQGDLLLFVFLLAGSMGGFAAGYYWRVLTEQRNRGD